jgi:hypothetical protein
MVVVKPNFSIRRAYGAIRALTAHFLSFFLFFVAYSSLLAPHSQQNWLEKCLGHHRKS